MTAPLPPMLVMFWAYNWLTTALGRLAVVMVKAGVATVKVEVKLVARPLLARSMTLVGTDTV